ncbi:hypothetical protein CAPN002_14590 [Capnocytophaga stomatis]|uniref:hypothetical protein n=1 Tax=Capnocytophaga stomatis TaxID=1848904 RepID=UPI00194F5A15|nr:hypothetical protein [Capnocytophaga stomatis]GIJ94241.1 hypothetical protein CAPN002_14590 [Capnocytophaga stomatis]
MKYLIKLGTIISFTLISCSVKKVEFKIISAEKTGENYSYNPIGFIKSGYGKLNINTISHYDKAGKLKKILWNRANGFVEYTLSELKNDAILLSSFNIDTIFSDKKYINYIKEKKNDTIFYVLDNKIVMKIKQEKLD